MRSACPPARRLDNRKMEGAAATGGDAFILPALIHLACVMPPTVVAVPPAAARTFASPAPKSTPGAYWATRHAALAAHVMPAAIVATAHVSCGPGDQAFFAGASAHGATNWCRCGYGRGDASANEQ